MADVRETTVRLTVEARGAQALTDLANRTAQVGRAAERAGQQAQTAHRQFAGMGSGGGVPGGAAGAAGAGGGGLNVPWARGLLGIAGALQLAQSAGPIAQAATNSSLTAFQANRQIAGALPFGIGGALKSIGDFSDAITGVTDATNRMRDAFQRATAGVQIEAARRERAGEAETALFGLQERARASAEGRRDVAVLARQLAVAERQGGGGPEAQRIFGAEAGAIGAGVGADVAAAAAGRAAQMAAADRDRLALAESRLREMRLTAPGKEGVRSAEQQLQYEKAHLDIKIQEQRVNEAQQAADKSRMASINAIGVAEQAALESRKAALNIDRERLAIVQEEEARVKGIGVAFGALTQSERAFAVRAARQAQERGAESLSADQAGVLQRAGGGDFLNRLRLEAVRDTPLFKDFLAATGQRDLADITRERVNLQTTVNASLLIDEAKLASEILRQAGPLYRDAIIEATKVAREQKQQLFTSQLIGAAQGKGGP